MAPPIQPTVLDVTIRDGSYLIGHQYSPQKVGEIVKGLAESGVDCIEVCHGAGIGSALVGYPSLAEDSDLLEAACEAAPNVKFSILINAAQLSLPIIPGLVSMFSIGRVGFKQENKEIAGKIFAKLKKYQKTTTAQLINSHSKTPEALSEEARIAVELGADIVYVVDSYGSFLPSDAKEYVSAVKAKVKVPIGYHGHNSFGCAIPNTIAAWQAGAEWLDASLMGVGKGAGNAVLESLIADFQRRDLLAGINLGKLCAVTRDTILPLFTVPPHSRQLDLLLAKARLACDSPEILELFATALHFPLNLFIEKIQAKAGARGVILDDDIKSTLEENGQNYDEMLKILKSFG